MKLQSIKPVYIPILLTARPHIPHEQEIKKLLEKNVKASITWKAELRLIGPIEDSVSNPICLQMTDATYEV